MNKHTHPQIFHKKVYYRSYFEGWYYKHVTKDGQHSISLIPGVSFEGGSKKSFIQCIYHHAKNELKTYNVDYSIQAFGVCQEPFQVRIEKNIFSMKGIRLAVKEPHIQLRGELRYGALTPIQSSVISPNIMGFFSYIPFMECNHAVLSMGHALKGCLEIEGEVIDFTGGIGYIEKDWGRSFPKHYTWIQSNHFDTPKVALFCAVATIPFLGCCFKGFICNLIYEDIEYRFATYNGTRLVLYEQSKDTIHLMLKHRQASLEIQGKVELAKKLWAPKMGRMNSVIKEGLSGVVDIILRDSKNTIILRTEGKQCGIEIVL